MGGLGEVGGRRGGRKGWSSSAGRGLVAVGGEAVGSWGARRTERGREGGREGGKEGARERPEGLRSVANERFESLVKVAREVCKVVEKRDGGWGGGVRDQRVPGLRGVCSHLPSLTLPCPLLLPFPSLEHVPAGHPCPGHACNHWRLLPQTRDRDVGADVRSAQRRCGARWVWKVWESVEMWGGEFQGHGSSC